MRIHRDKLERALRLMAQGKSTREVAKETGLSFGQLKKIREVSDVYVEVETYKKRLEKLREEKLPGIKGLENLDSEIKAREERVRMLKEAEHRAISEY